MTPVDLDDLLDRELEQLPAPTAPGTLLPRVMAAAQERAAARWYRQAWLAWPLPAQAVSLVALLALVAGLVLLMPGAGQAAGRVSSLVDLPDPAGTLAFLRILKQGLTLMRVSWEVLLQPVATFVAVLTVFVSLGCAALWSALNRFALGGASHP